MFETQKWKKIDAVYILAPVNIKLWFVIKTCNLLQGEEPNSQHCSETFRKRTIKKWNRKDGPCSAMCCWSSLSANTPAMLLQPCSLLPPQHPFEYLQPAGARWARVLLINPHLAGILCLLADFNMKIKMEMETNWVPGKGLKNVWFILHRMEDKSKMMSVFADHINSSVFL